MRDMTPTERSYVAGIIDGEGYIEFTQRQRTRHDQKRQARPYCLEHSS